MESAGQTLANTQANVRRTGPRSCHVICFSTDLYIICGLLLLYTINIVWYSDLLFLTSFVFIFKDGYIASQLSEGFFFGCTGGKSMA